jgi:hypothetical protein
MLKIVVRQVPLKMTPNFQRQHYLYWCNVYNLSQGNQAVFPNTTIRVQHKGKQIFLIDNIFFEILSLSHPGRWCYTLCV